MTTPDSHFDGEPQDATANVSGDASSATSAPLTRASLRTSGRAAAIDEGDHPSVVDPIADMTGELDASDVSADTVDESIAPEQPAAPRPRRRAWDDPDDFTPDDATDLVDTRTRSVMQWAVPVGLVALAAATRFIGLDQPHELVFDETYYVKDAYTLSQLGYESTWGDEPNPGFVMGKPDFTTTGAFVVHPPLGKWIIASGFALFGADNGWGWRFATALAGVITVLLTYFLAKKLTRSVVWAGLAGLFVAVDGVSIVMSRVSLLDGILAMFLVMGVLFVTLDRPALKRVSEASTSALGNLIYRRPWIIAAGIAFGAATAVKWSGAYALAGFGIYLVVTDALARHRSGAQNWIGGSLAQGALSFVYLVPAAVVTYLASWTGWILTTGGYGRGKEGGWFVALWDYHRQVLDFHSGLSSAHPYSSPAWQWPLLVRPTAMLYETNPDNANLISTITPIPNPLIWWVGIIATFYLLYRFAYKPTWTMPIVLTALAVTYLPWLAVPNRTIFQFYTVVMVPFLATAIVMAMRQLAGSTREPTPQQYSWRLVISVFVGVVILVSVFFFPLWTGIEIPRWYWQLHMWLPSWI